jgi:hypothetical protein
MKGAGLGLSNELFIVSLAKLSTVSGLNLMQSHNLTHGNFFWKLAYIPSTWKLKDTLLPV